MHVDHCVIRSEPLGPCHSQMLFDLEDLEKRHVVIGVQTPRLIGAIPVWISALAQISFRFDVHLYRALSWEASESILACAHLIEASPDHKIVPHVQIL